MLKKPKSLNRIGADDQVSLWVSAEDCTGNIKTLPQIYANGKQRNSLTENVLLSNARTLISSNLLKANLSTVPLNCRAKLTTYLLRRNCSNGVTT